MAPLEDTSNATPQIANDIMEVNIRKSSNDSREYKFLYLKNQLKLLLISDPETEKSAASVNVHVGHTSDPDNVPGIAHFCEHMLFLGTKKYPGEGEFDKFISKHGGAENASTAAEFTNYYFDIKSEMLFAAMDRFAQFFISPLFNADATDRELHAIESEHQKNILDDSHRMYYINKSTVSPGHVYSKFGTGNLETLKTFPVSQNIDIRELLLDFHSNYYSSNIMTVAVLGREPLGELEKVIVPLFEQVPNKHFMLPLPQEFPYGEEELGILIKIPTIKDMKKLELRFTLPDLLEHYKCSPADFAARLIGHEGAGSLLSLLKKKLWVNSLSCGAYNVLRGFDFFDINMDLTEDGFGRIWEIVALCFHYIHMLKAEGPEKRLYEEMRVLEEVKFRFKGKEEPMDYVEWVTKNMHLYPSEDILRGPYGVEYFEPDLIKHVLDFLTPTNFRCTIQSPTFKGKTDLVSKYYNAEYSVERIPQDLIDKWMNMELHPELHLPADNFFIPESFDVVVPNVVPKVVPFLMKDNNMLRVWYKPDDTFFVPKSVLTISITCPHACLTPSNVNHLKMFILLLDDQLAEFSYDAELAGISYDLRSSLCGFSIEISGFSNKQVVLLKKILQQIINMDIEESRFDVNKTQYEQSLNNIAMQEPYKQIGGLRKSLLKQRTWTAEDKLEHLPALTKDSMKYYVGNLLLKTFYVECLLCGNMLLEEMNSICSVLEYILIGGRFVIPLMPAQHHIANSREFKLLKNTTYLYEKRSKIHQNSCVMTYMQVGLQRVRTKVLCELFAQMTSSSFYNLLRTKEQLGYIVYTGVSMSASVIGIMSLVQSDQEPAVVYQKMRSFFTSFEESLLAMPEEQFRDYIEGVAVEKLEKPKQLESEVAEYWQEISIKQYNFQRKEKEVVELRKLEKSDLIKFYKKFIHPASVSRRQIVVAVLGKDSVGIGKQDESFHIVKDVLEFKSSLPMYSQILPHGSIPLVSTAQF